MTTAIDNDDEKALEKRRLPSPQLARSSDSARAGSMPKENRCDIVVDGDAAAGGVAKDVFRVTVEKAAGVDQVRALPAPVKTEERYEGRHEPGSSQEQSRGDVVAPGWEDLLFGEHKATGASKHCPAEGLPPPAGSPTVADHARGNLRELSCGEFSSQQKGGGEEERQKPSSTSSLETDKACQSTTGLHPCLQEDDDGSADRSGLATGESDLGKAESTNDNAAMGKVATVVVDEARSSTSWVEAEGDAEKDANGVVREHDGVAFAAVSNSGLLTGGQGRRDAMTGGSHVGAARAEEAGSGYRGDAAYAGLLIAEHLELFFRQQVRFCVTNRSLIRSTLACGN